MVYHTEIECSTTGRHERVRYTVSAPSRRVALRKALAYGLRVYGVANVPHGDRIEARIIGGGTWRTA